MAQTATRPAEVTSPLGRHVATEAAGRFVAAYWGSVLLVDLTGPSAVVVTTIAVGLLVAACSLWQPVPVAFGVAGIGWLFVTGFAVNGYGVLAVSGFGDVVRLFVLLAVAAAAAAVTHRAGAR